MAPSPKKGGGMKKQPTVVGPVGTGENSKLKLEKPPPMSEAEKKCAKDFFNAYDYDGSGTIDFGELTELLQDLNLPMEKDTLTKYVIASTGDDPESPSLGGRSAKSMFASMTSGMDASLMKIDFDNFCLIYLTIMSSQNPAVRKSNMGERINVSDLTGAEVRMRSAFASYDADGSGFLDADELKSLFHELGLPDNDGDQYTQLIEQAYKDQNSSPDKPISYEEFVHYRNMIVSGIEEAAETVSVW